MDIIQFKVLHYFTFSKNKALIFLGPRYTPLCLCKRPVIYHFLHYITITQNYVLPCKLLNHLANTMTVQKDELL